MATEAASAAGPARALAPSPKAVARASAPDVKSPGAFKRDNPQDRKQSGQQRNLIANRTRPLRAEVQQIDARMEKLAAERTALEVQLASGKLSRNMIADSYEARVDSQLRALTSILEPLLIVFMGLAVAFVALAVFVPYFQLVNSPVIAGDQ